LSEHCEKLLQSQREFHLVGQGAEWLFEFLTYAACVDRSPAIAKPQYFRSLTVGKLYIEVGGNLVLTINTPAILRLGKTGTAPA